MRCLSIKERPKVAIVTPGGMIEIIFQTDICKLAITDQQWLSSVWGSLIYTAVQNSVVRYYWPNWNPDFINDCERCDLNPYFLPVLTLAMRLTFTTGWLKAKISTKYCFDFFTATLIELTCFSMYSATVFLLNTSRDHSREETPCSTYIKQGSIGWGVRSTRWGILKDHDCVVANGASRIILQKHDWSSNSILISPSLCWCGSRITAILSSAGGCTLFHCLTLKQATRTVPVPEGRMLCLLRAKIHW